MKTRFVRSLKWILGVGAFVGLCVPVNRAMDASHAQVTPHADRRHMHMRNWALEPTGIPGVSPLDPARIPKFVNELTKPPVFVPDNTGTCGDGQSGQKQNNRKCLHTGLPKEGNAARTDAHCSTSRTQSDHPDRLCEHLKLTIHRARRHW